MVERSSADAGSIHGFPSGGEVMACHCHTTTTTHISGEGGTEMAGGRGRMPGGRGLGPGGECRCPNCGTTIPHKRGVPCSEEICPNCGARMIRP